MISFETFVVKENYFNIQNTIISFYKNLLFISDTIKHNENTYFKKDLQYYKFCLYGFLKNLRFFEPFLVLFFLEKELTFLQIGVLFSIREIVRNILEIPAGVFADALGRRRTMIFSFSFYIISFIVFYLSADYAMFILAMVFYAIGDAFRTGTHKAMIFEYLEIKGWPSAKVHYYGHTRSWSQMGSALSALIAGFVVFFSGSYEMIFLYSAIPYVLDLLLMISYPKVLDGDIIKLQKGETTALFRKVIREFLISFKNTKVLKAITNVSVYSGYFRAVKDFLQPVVQAMALSLPFLLYLNDDQRTSILIGVVYFFIFALSSFASRRSGSIAGKFSSISKPLNLTLIIGLLTGVIIGLFYNYGILILSVMFYMGIYMIENVRRPMGVSYVSEVLPGNILATALSAESQAKSIFTVILAPLIGFLSDTYGLGTGLMAVSVLVLLTVPLYYLKSKE